MSQLLEALETFLPSIRETGMETWTIVDGTANVGGETLAWLYYLFVQKKFTTPVFISVECQPRTYLALCHNLQLYRQQYPSLFPESQTMSICESVLSFWKSIPVHQTIDLLILDPPWGGPQYRHHPTIDSLYFMSPDGPVELLDALQSMLAHHRPRFLLVKVPKQYRENPQWERLPLDELYLFQHMKFKWLFGRVTPIQTQ